MVLVLQGAVNKREVIVQTYAIYKKTTQKLNHYEYQL